MALVRPRAPVRRVRGREFQARSLNARNNRLSFVYNLKFGKTKVGKSDDLKLEQVYNP